MEYVCEKAIDVIGKIRKDSLAGMPSASVHEVAGSSFQGIKVEISNVFRLKKVHCWGLLVVGNGVLRWVEVRLTYK